MVETMYLRKERFPSPWKSQKRQMTVCAEAAMNDEINLTRTIMDIHEKVTSVQKDVQHLTQRGETRQNLTKSLIPDFSEPVLQ